MAMFFLDENGNYYETVIDVTSWPAGHQPTAKRAPPQTPGPVPNLSFPQLLFGLVTEGFITETEGNAWLVSRVLPASVEAVISGLPGPDQLLARARALQPTDVIYADPLIQMMGAIQGRTEAQMADFFRAYAVV